MEYNYSKNIYVLIFIFVLIHYTWYYVTLPGSYLSPNNKDPQPSYKSGLISYFMFTLPGIFFIYYLSTKDLNCNAINTYISVLCHK